MGRGIRGLGERHQGVGGGASGNHIVNEVLTSTISREEGD